MTAKKQGFGLQWHVTDLCDQRCRHCYIFNNGDDSGRKGELSLKEAFRISDLFLQFCKSINRTPSISVTGGDPLLYKVIWRLLESFKTKGINFSIMGNPFHLDAESCERLRYLGCHHYQMSMDGLRETHDTIRKKGSFNETVAKIKLLKKHGVKATIMSTVSKLNYKEIPDLIRFVTAVGVDSFAFARYCPSAMDRDLILSPVEYRDLLEKCWMVFEELSERKTIFSLKDHLWTLFLYERGLFELRGEDLIFEGCNCGIQHLTLLPDGQVYACRRFESPVGNIATESFSDIFWGEKMEYYRQYKRFAACKNCKLLNYCRGCPAVAQCVTGDFYARDPQCWI
ncbi:MAG: radical SAM/SPASM domain protein, ACGX system [Patescibacteria group bacterium]|jgi:radical SAM/SPASM domain protein of ACGX system